MNFDFVIVGAGSAGCVLANRLSADGRHRVLLVEAGPKNTALSLKIPAAVLQNLKSTKHNWAFQGEPEPQLGGRVLTHDRGKTLGGSSSINGMVFIRGHALDFEGWRQAGCEGWGYADVLPYFKRMENYGGGECEYRGAGG
ncbi:MAG: GMC family oxidoreductase N-terminal domain-containing protein, partial [Alphaproteobacteria bacterium]